MKKLLMLCVVIVGGSSGCMHVQPIGPLADTFGGSKLANSDAKRSAIISPDNAKEPIIRAAPKPTPPALYVTPGEVTSSNVDEALKRLNQELETDRRGIDAMPKYAEISKVK